MGITSEITIREAVHADCNQLARMRSSLWPDSSIEEHTRDVSQQLDSVTLGGLPVINLVAEASDRLVVGFVEAGLRSHADGCDISRPVGYIEGWYVAAEFRNRGIGGKLLAAAEEWALRQGCREMASDALIDNDGSQRAHEALGYSVVDRCVHYRKQL
jgi:aminoglycoside 6'-N-acetyltransferase I